MLKKHVTQPLILTALYYRKTCYITPRSGII